MLIRRVPESLPWAFYPAHGKERIFFKTCKERICRVSARKHTATMLFAVCQVLAHDERGVSPCVNPQAHGEHESHGLHAGLPSRDRVMASRPSLFTVCQSQAHGKLKSSQCAICLAHGEHEKNSYFCF